VLFTQTAAIVRRYIEEKVRVQRPADVKDLFLSPYFGHAVEILLGAIRPDTSQGEAPEIPRYELNRGPGSTQDVDFWTSRPVREVVHSHVNYVVADTKRWEQSAAYYIDTHSGVAAFVKNAGLGFAVPYLYNGQVHDYVPDFLIRLKGADSCHLILETKGYDPLLDVKKAAAERWVDAVNAEGSYGRWHYDVVLKLADIRARIDDAVKSFGELRSKSGTQYMMQ
jgi:type III restriction enzyme